MICALYPSQAAADFNVCNDTKSKLGIALGYADRLKWKSEGWWNINPGDCKTLITGDLTGRYYYLQAEEYDKGTTRSGRHQMCIDDRVFTIVGFSDCEKRGYKSAGFIKVYTFEKKSWTARFWTGGLTGSATNTSAAPISDALAKKGIKIKKHSGRCEAVIPPDAHRGDLVRLVISSPDLKEYSLSFQSDFGPITGVIVADDRRRPFERAVRIPRSARDSAKELANMTALQEVFHFTYRDGSSKFSSSRFEPLDYPKILRGMAERCSSNREALRPPAIDTKEKDKSRVVSERFELWDNYDAFGNDISRHNRVSVSRCESLCRKQSGCDTYTYNKRYRACFLKSGARLVIPNPNALTASRKPEFRKGTMRAYDNADFAGGDYLRVRGRDMIECYEMCEKDSGCAGFSYVYKIQSCWLKSYVSGVAAKRGVSLYVK